MTREEAIEVLEKMKYPQKVNKNGFVISNVDIENKALEMAIQALSSWEKYSDKLWKEAYERGKTEALSQEPCEDIAQERYKDLCEYFGGAKDILKSREDFKAWLGRVKWHIRKAEELYEKYEYKQEPCDDVISRKKAICVISACDGKSAQIEALEQLPSVTQKSGKWKREEFPNFTVAWFCNKCGIGSYRKSNYCPNCGACMKDGRTLDEFIEDSKESE